MAESDTTVRFLSDSDINTTQFVDQMRNCNTVQATKSHLRLFTRWLTQMKSERRPPEEIDAKQLDIYLAQFTLNVRKEGSTEINHPSRQYEPSSLAAIHSSIYRHLSSKNYPHNIKTSELFTHSRNVLTAKMKELKQIGKGNKPHAAQSFTADEIILLIQHNLRGVGKPRVQSFFIGLNLFLLSFYTCINSSLTRKLIVPNIACLGNPEAIINSMWLNTTLYFGLRGRQEHVLMLWGDMELKSDDQGVQYLEFHEPATKTRQGSTRDVRAFPPKMYATGRTVLGVY